MITLLFGTAGCGKSFLLLYLALYLLEKNKVDTFIYVDGDNSSSVLEDRNIPKYLRYFGKNKFMYIPSENVNKDTINTVLNNIENEKFGKTVIVFDSIRNVTMGKNIDKDNTVMPIMEKFQAIRNLGTTVILVHHTNKLGQLKNSTAINDYSEVTYEVIKDQEEDNILKINLECKKDRVQVHKNLIAEINTEINYFQR